MYQLAYEQMDASAAQRVWPTVDVRALSRAFDSLQSQEINFHHCDLRVAGKNAQASCKGSGTFVPRVGSRDPRTVQREWSFQLEKVNDAWMIARTEDSIVGRHATRSPSLEMAKQADLDVSYS